MSVTANDQNEENTEIRQHRAQMYVGDIVWLQQAGEVPAEQKAATLKDQEDRRKAFKRKQVAAEVTNRRNANS